MSEPRPAAPSERPKVLSAEEAAACRPWALPEVGPGPGGTLTVAELERLQRQAYEEAYAKGLAEGRRRGEDEVQARARQLGALLQALGRPLAQVDEEVEQELAQLALAIAKLVIRRELATHPGEVVAVIREALGILPAGARRVRVHLHPEDAALVRQLLAEGVEEEGWRVVEDPALSRGGCRVVTESSQIDATLERRLQAIAAQVLGGGRE
ncbi:MAG: flagellar assembly protein FliH, partial [Gammaproteobacteria bacterium]